MAWPCLYHFNAFGETIDGFVASEDCQTTRLLVQRHDTWTAHQSSIDPIEPITTSSSSSISITLSRINPRDGHGYTWRDWLPYCFSRGKSRHIYGFIIKIVKRAQRKLAYISRCHLGNHVVHHHRTDNYGLIGSASEEIAITV